VSKSGGERNGTGHEGIAGGWVAGELSGSTTLGVTITISSVTEWFRFLERKSCPKMGISPMPGILLSESVMRLSSSPEMAKLCPSFNSISVSALRVEMAGTV